MKVTLCVAVVGVLLAGRAAVAADEAANAVQKVQEARDRLEALTSLSNEERREVVNGSAPVLMFEALRPGQESATLYEEGAAAIRAHAETADPDYMDLPLLWWLTYPKELAGRWAIPEWTPATEAALEVTLAVAGRTKSPLLEAAALLGAARALIGHDWPAACRYASQAYEIEANWVGGSLDEAHAMEYVVSDLVELFDLRFDDASQLIEKVAREMHPCPIAEAELLERCRSVRDADPGLVSSIPLMLASIPRLRIVECKDSGGPGKIVFERVYWGGYSKRSDEGPPFGSPWGDRNDARRKAAREVLER